ncbi:MAG: hypothetical protein IJK41_00900 [Muribaculaceae bacterium]|nr:hypothetical protein [Muribaculaceae bacterium]
MAKLLKLLLIIIPLLLGSCGGDEPVNPNNNQENQGDNGNNNNGNNNNNDVVINYYFTSYAIRINPDAGSVSIDITSNTEWEITSVTGNVTGFSLSGPTKGTGDVHLKASYSKVPNPNEWNESEYINFRVKKGTNKDWWYENTYFLITRSGRKTPV